MIRHRGVTLIEVLVVIGIVGGLVALFLPAIQQAREMARRNQCKNHEKQLGIALHAYHDTYRVFPLLGNNTRWSVAILPYLERADLYDRYDHSTGPDSPTNLLISREVVVPLTCPSESLESVIPSDSVAAHFSANILMMEKSLAACTKGSTRVALMTELRSSNLIPWTRGPAFHLGPQNSAHGTRVNVLFGDGHVESVNGDDAEQMVVIGNPGE